MVNGIIEELMDLDLEPKPESLLWTSTHKHEDTTTLRVGSRGRAWELPFREVVFELLGYRYHRDSKVPNAPCARAWEACDVIITSTARRQFRWRPSASVSIAMFTALSRMAASIGFGAVP